MYHLELRKFPHNLCRFNMSEGELREIVEPWAREQWVELEERKWSPHESKLRILEGPQIPTEQLSMGRGWRYALRQSEDVTKRVLDRAKTTGSAATRATMERDRSGETQLVSDSLGLELLSQLGTEPAPLSRAWQIAAARCPERSPSKCLGLAETAVRSLLRSRLIVLLDVPSGQATRREQDTGREQATRRAQDTGREQDAGRQMSDGEIDLLLGAIESWTGNETSAGLRMLRT